MKQLKQLQAHLTAHGLLYRTHTLAALIAFCSLTPTADLNHARQLFDRCIFPNRYMFNTLIRGYSNSNTRMEAFVLLRRMMAQGCRHECPPTRLCVFQTLLVCPKGNALLDMYGKCGEPHLAQMLFDRMPVKNVVTWTSLVQAYGKNGFLDLARCCFDEMQERSTVSWNAMMDCYVSYGDGHQALDLYERMQASCIIQDESTLVNVLSACSQIGNFVVGKRTHDYIVQTITNPSLTLLNSIIDMYAKCGHIDIAFGLFSLLDNKNVVSWNIMISASAIHGNAMDAIALFKTMENHGFWPDGITFVGLLSACSHGGLLEAGQHYFEAMEAIYNVTHEIEHYACMVDMFGRRGYVNQAIEVIRSMPMKPDVVIWGALLGACRIHIDVKTGLQVMRQILRMEPFSSGLFVLMSNLFSEARQWEEMRMLRKLMDEGGMRKVEGRSLIEIDGEMHEFLVEDIKHESSSKIYMLIDQLTGHLMFLASPYNTLEELVTIEE